MKIILTLFILITSSIFANQTNTVLETSLKENDLSSDAIFILENPLESKNIFLSYQNDLIVITINNAIMVNKNSYPKATDKRISRTLVHSPNLNRVDYRIRFKNDKFVKPELNEIRIENNKVIVKLFKSQKDMLLFHLQEKNANNQIIKSKEKSSQSNTITTKNVIEAQVLKKKEVGLRTKNIDPLVKKSESIEKINNTIAQRKTTDLLKEKDNVESKALIASPAPSSFNTTLFMILLFLGAIALYLKKKNGNISLGNEGVKILSSKSLGNKKQLIMVEANGNKLLLATSESGVQVLSGLKDNNEERSIEYQENEDLEYSSKNKPKKDFKSDLDEEIDQLEKSFFQKKSKKNPYIQEEDEPEVVTHFSKKLRNIKKL
jgi:flagellar biogenesis protein FliO